MDPTFVRALVKRFGVFVFGGDLNEGPPVRIDPAEIARRARRSEYKAGIRRDDQAARFRREQERRDS